MVVTVVTGGTVITVTTGVLVGVVTFGGVTADTGAGIAGVGCTGLLLVPVIALVVASFGVVFRAFLFTAGVLVAAVGVETT